MANEYLDYVDNILGTVKPKTQQVDEAATNKVASLGSASEKAVKQVDAVAPMTVVRDTNGNIVSSDYTGDADSQAGARLTYEDGSNKTFDAWETYHEGYPPNPKKMEKQRRALATLMDVPYEDVTDQHVFNMGAATAAKKNDLVRRANDGKSKDILEVTRDKLLNGVDKSGGGRDLTTESVNNTSTVDALNNPMDNADFYSSFNVEGRAAYNRGSTKAEGDNVYSDRQASEGTTLERTYNALLGAGDSMANIAAGVGNAAADAATYIKGSDAAIATQEKDIIDSIIAKREERTKKINTQTEINKAREDYIKANPESANKTLADGKPNPDYVGNRFRDIPNSKEITYTDAEKKYLATGYYPVINRNNEDGQSKPKEYLSEFAATGEEAVTAMHKDYIDRETKMKSLPNPQGRWEVKDVGGKPSLVAKEYSNKYNEKKAMEDISVEAQAVSDAIDSGDVLKGITNLSKGIGKTIWKHPEATAQFIVDSLPEMAWNLTTGGSGLMVQANRSYNTQLDNFKKEHGRNPDEGEQQIMVAMGVGKAISDKGTDKLFIDGTFTNAGKELAETLAAKGIPMAKSIGIVKNLAMGTTAETFQEGYTQAMEEYGAKQDLAKMDKTNIAKAAIMGGASGHGMTATLNAPAAIDAVTSDITSVKNNFRNYDKNDRLTARGLKQIEADPTKVDTSNSVADAIAKVESGTKGYNAYNRGNASQGTEDIDFSTMTVGEITALQSKDKGDPERVFALGKYQLIPDTMAAAIKALGISPDEKFTPALQERLFTDYLVKQKRPTMYNYIVGKHDNVDDAQTAMAQEWASVAKDESNKSWYAGDSAGNKAHMSDKEAESFLKNARSIYESNIKSGMKSDAAYRAAMYGGNSEVNFDMKYSRSSAKVMQETEGLYKYKGSKMVSEPDWMPSSLDMFNDIHTTDSVDNMFTTPEVETNTADAVKLDMELSNFTPEEIAADNSLSTMQAEKDNLQAQTTEMSDEDFMAMFDQMVEQEMNSGQAATLPSSVVSAVLSGALSPTDVKLDKLGTATKAMITKLSALNQHINREPELKKTMQNVEAEKLGTDTVDGKAGLGKHLTDIAATVYSGALAPAQFAVGKLQKFVNDQQDKIDAMKYGVAQGDEWITMESGFTFKNEVPAKTRNVIKKLEKELEVLNQGMSIAKEMFQAKFVSKFTQKPTEKAQETIKPEPVKSTKPKSTDAEKASEKPVKKYSDVDPIVNKVREALVTKPDMTVEDIQVEYKVGKVRAAKIMEAIKETEPKVEVKEVSQEVKDRDNKIAKDIGNSKSNHVYLAAEPVPTRKATANEVSKDLLAEGSLKAIIKKAIRVSKNSTLKEYAKLIGKIVAKKDITVITSVDGKQIVNPFAHYETNTIGLVEPNNGSLVYVGTSYNMVLHEASHILLQDYLNGDAKTDTQKTLQKEYARILAAYNASLKEDKENNKNIPSALNYANSAAELYAMSMNSAVVKAKLESIIDTGSVAKGYTLLDSIFDALWKTLKDLAGIKVNLDQSLTKLKLTAFRELADELTGFDAIYVAALNTAPEGSMIPVSMYRMIMANPKNVTKQGKVHTRILKGFGMDAKMRDQLHEAAMYAGTASDTISEKLTVEEAVNTLEEEIIAQNAEEDYVNSTVEDISEQSTLPDTIDLTFKPISIPVVSITKDSPFTKVLYSVLNYAPITKFAVNSSDVNKITTGIKSLVKALVVREDTHPSILSQFNMADPNVDRAIKDKLSVEEYREYTKVKEFIEKFTKALERVTPKYRLGETTVLSNMAVVQPHSMLTAKNGTVHKNISDAMAMAALMWVSNNGFKTSFITNEDMARMLGVSEDKLLLNKQARTYGVPFTSVAESIGKETLRLLNLKQNSNADAGVDAFYEARLAQSFGDLALFAMKEMSGDNLVEFKHIDKNLYTNMIKDNEGGADSILNIEPTEKTVMTVRVPIALDGRGYPVTDTVGNRLYSSNIATLKSMFDSVNYKTMYKKLYTPTVAIKGVSIKPIEEVAKYYKGTRSKVPKLLSRALTALQSHRLVPNANFNLYKTMSKETWLTIHGWVTPEFIAAQSEGLQDGYVGKNQTLEQEYNKLIQHEQNMEEMHNKERIRSKQFFATERAALLDNLKDNGFYLGYTAFKNSRMGDTSDTISIQRSKMHRNMFSFKQHIEVIENDNQEHIRAVVQSLTEPMGLNDKVDPYTAVDLFYETVMSKEGVIHDPVIRQAIEEIQKANRNEKYNELLILEATKKLKEHGHSLLALQGLAAWNESLTGDKKSNTWVSEMYTEVDGTTNGVIALVRQLSTEFTKDEHENLTRLLNAGGLIFVDQPYTSAMEYLRSGKLDIYKTVGIKTAETIHSMLTAKVPTVEEFRKAKALIKQTKGDAKDDAKLALRKLKARKAVHILSEIMPPYVTMVNGSPEINADGRNAAKPFVMTGAYQAGKASQIRGSFYSTKPKSILDTFYIALQKAVETKDNTYINKFNAVIASALENQGSERSHTVTQDNALKELPFFVTDALFEEYKVSYGEEMVASYKEAIGATVDNAGEVVTAMSIVSAIGSYFINKAIKEAGIGRTPLNKQERASLIEKLQKQGIYIGLQSAASEGHTDALITMNTTKTALTKEDGGRVEHQNIGEYSSTYIDANGEAKPVKYSNRNSTLKVETIDEEAGVSPVTSGNISIDGYTQARLAVEDDTAFGNVYDARTLRVTDATDKSQETNAVWDSVFNTWSMYDSVKERLDFMMELLKTLPEEVQEEIEFKRMNHKMFPMEENFKEFQYNFNDLVFRGNKSRIAINEQLAILEQYRMEGSAKKIRDKVKLSGAEPVIDTDTDTLIEELGTKASPANVMKLFTLLTGSTVSEDTHLEDVLTATVLPLVSSSHNFIVEYKSTKGNSPDAVVFDISPTATIFGEEMSAKERLVNSLLYPVWKAALGSSTATLSRVSELHEQAREVLEPTDIGSDMHNQLFNTPNGIVDFAVVSMTNRKVMDALANKVGKTKTTYSVVEQLYPILDKVLRVFNSRYTVGNRETVPTLLVQLASTMYDTKLFFAEELWNTSKKYMEVLNSKKDEVIAKLDKVIKDNPTMKSIRLPLTVFDKASYNGLTTVIKSTVDRINNDTLTDLHREAQGHNVITASYRRLLLRMNNEVEAGSIKLQNATKNYLSSKFKNLSLEDNVSLTQSVLRTDLSTLSNIDSVTHLLNVPTEITKTVADLMRTLPTKDASYITKQTDSLANLMIKGIPTTIDGHTNAFNIAQHVRGTESMIKTIDTIKTLKALSMLSEKDKQTLVKQLRNNKDGVKALMETNKAMLEDKLLKVYGGDRSRVIAGEVEDIQVSGVAHAISKENLTLKGFKKIQTLPNGYTVYAKYKGSKNPYNKGIVSIASDSLEGAFVKLKDVVSYDGLIPVMQYGKIIGYRVITPVDAKTKVGIRNKAIDVVSRSSGNRVRIDSGTKANNELISVAANDFKTNYSKNKGAFIAITEFSTNEQVKEFMSLVPYAFKKQLEKEFPNGNMYIRKDMLNLIIGYRKFSFANHLSNMDFRNNSLSTFAKIPKGNAAYVPDGIVNVVKISEEIWQAAIGEVKRRVVLLTPTVIIGNFASNFVLSMVFGMNPVQTARDQMEGLNAIKQYTKWETEYATLKAKQRAGTITTIEVNRAKELEVLKHTSNIAPLMDAGVFSIIVDDVTTATEDNFSSKVMGSIRGNMEFNKVDSAMDTFRNFGTESITVGKVLAYASMSPSTELGNNIQLATAYSDFMARYAMYKHLIAEGKTEQDAINEVMEIFVDYTPNSSKGLQYINDMGLLMYTKFFIRIQKVIMRMLRENPIGSLAVVLAEQFMGNIPEITDSFFVGGVSAGSSQNPAEVVAALSDIPMLHFIKDLL